MKKSLWNQRFPTLLGIILIVVGIGVTSFLVNRGVITFSRAAPSQDPQTARITNTSDVSFTVSYRTAGAVPGSIAYGKTKDLGLVALDERDQVAGSAKNYQIHSITIRDLQPNTKYFFSIISGNGTFLDNGTPFTVTTAPTGTTKPTSQQPLTGKIISSDGTALADSIVYLSITNAQSLSTLTKSDGTYIIPLNTILTKDLSSLLTITPDTSMNLLILGQTQQSTVVLTTKQSSPVPIITLSQNYNFSSSTTPLDADQSALASQAAQTSFPFLSASEIINNKTPQVLSPKNGETFTDQQPVFNGTASPNTDVKVVINSNSQIESNVKTNANGNWSFRPNTKLSPGSHKVTVATKDSLGILNTITRSFTVYAQGSQVSQTATPSATITPKLTTTISPTPTLFVLPTPTTGIIQPSTIPTQVVLPSGTTKGGQPIKPPGSATLVTIGIGAIVTTIIGVLLFIFI